MLREHHGVTAEHEAEKYKIAVAPTCRPKECRRKGALGHLTARHYDRRVRQRVLRSFYAASRG